AQPRAALFLAAFELLEATVDVRDGRRSRALLQFRAQRADGGEHVEVLLHRTRYREGKIELSLKRGRGRLHTRVHPDGERLRVRLSVDREPHRVVARER